MPATPPPRPAALITGGAIRLGRSIALALAEQGYDIALHYHSSTGPAEETAAQIRAFGVACRTLRCDLARSADLDGLIADAVAAFPALRVLVNSASGYVQANIGDSRPEDFDQLFAVNLRAPYFLSAAFAARVAQGEIINIIDNKIGFNQFKYAAYLLTKKALADFTRMAALEFAPRIRVNGVAPGVIDPMASRSAEYIQWRIRGIPVQRKGENRHITAALLHLLQNDFVNGQVLAVDGGENIAHTGRNAGDYDPAKV